MLQSRDDSAGEIFEKLAVDDIRNATDVLRPVFDTTRGADGFVSIEVSPYLAMDTQGTVRGKAPVARGQPYQLDDQGAGDIRWTTGDS